MKNRINRAGCGPVTAVCDSDVRVECVTEQCTPDAWEYHALITNAGAETVRLKSVCLLSVDDLPACGLGGEPYRIFRSGRHKNDMPGVFETGCMDERLRDVSSVMAESGDGMQAQSGSRVMSDHLTLIQGGEGCLSVAFLTGRDQLFQTVIALDEEAKFASLRSEVLFGIDLLPGETFQTESIRVALVRDVNQEIRDFADRKAALCGSRAARRPAVFCTWYYYGLTVTYEDVKRNLQIMKERKLPYDVFQVDEGWEVTLGQYEPNDKFLLTMKQLADEIREAGYVPGLWSSPFVAHETADVWREHPEWMLRDASGAPCLFPMNGTVYYVFDITHPAACDYFRDLYRMFTFDWGYPYHKLDFTRAAVIYEDASFYDRRITLAQAYRRAVQAIRDGMGEDAFFLMCGGLYDPIIGLVDAQRTGSDVLSMWASNINKDGKTAPYTIRQSMLRSYMNRWWANDPDALMVRVNPDMERDVRMTYGLLNGEEVKTCVVNQFAGGGIMCQTEPLDKITDDRLMEIRRILPVVDTVAEPLNWLDGERFPGAMDVYIPQTDAHCLCVINWSDTQDKPVEIDLSQLKLDADAAYAVCGYYSGLYRAGVHADEKLVLGAIRPHGAEVIKIEKMKDKPIIVASDGHYAMGAECTRLEWDGGRLLVEKPSILPADTHMRILLPGDWREVCVTLGPGCERLEKTIRDR